MANLHYVIQLTASFRRVHDKTLRHAKYRACESFFSPSFLLFLNSRHERTSAGVDLETFSERRRPPLSGIRNRCRVEDFLALSCRRSAFQTDDWSQLLTFCIGKQTVDSCRLHRTNARHLSIGWVRWTLRYAKDKWQIWWLSRRECRYCAVKLPTRVRVWECCAW